MVVSRLSQRVAHAALSLRGFRSRYVPSSAGRVHLLEAKGTGRLPPLVVLHGLSAAGFHYYPFIRHLLPQVRRVVAIDLPGHGLSDVPARGLDPETLRVGVTAAFDALEREGKPVLFGNSLGGLVALRHALGKPEQVRGLVLFSPAGAAMSGEQLEGLRRGFQLDSHRAALEFIDRVTARPGPLRQVLAWGARQGFAAPHIRQLLDEVSTDTFFTEEELAALRVPTLLLWGEHDRLLPGESFEFFRRALPAHAEVERVPGVGHTPFLDGARAVAVRVLRFLQRLNA